MMKSHEVRKTFQDFFASKQHRSVSSAPMVIKNDPTLMFTNAGMNQFKDIFLGNSPATHPRVANTQKCLRVSGKHNDLEEVGHDTYHHTMFEMLGNWSFGDYFKKEAIEWAWELLTRVYKIDPDNLYVTIFGGDEADGLSRDEEAGNYWKAIVPAEKIIYGSRKDNFWEMGDTGPCGPCSEIHIDLRPETDKKKIPGREMVNTGHPLVIEIWNLVFIEFNRKQDGSLHPLPAKHVDTGMGFERLCMVMQGVTSNYDTDVFQPLISALAGLAGTSYGADSKKDVAMRVVSDHIRAIAFAVADGQLPSNNKAGYVIRRILRRAVRYGYTFLGFREPFMYRLLPVLAGEMGETFPELRTQLETTAKVIAEEEQAFLRTLAVGIQKFESYRPATGKKTISGDFAFELFDTYGFPPDLTCLMAKEQGMEVDMDGFGTCMEEQKNRSRKAAVVEKDDWTVIRQSDEETRFIGYDTTESSAVILKYRNVKQKDKELLHIVLDQTPFYAEAGGQAGDKGQLISGNETVQVINTVKENNLIVHICLSLPSDPVLEVKAVADPVKRALTAANHSATHLLHAALRRVLGTHVEQKGSLVNDERLRFDFSHFSKMEESQIEAVEAMVNLRIRQNIALAEERNVPMEKAKAMGAIALFGEKYGDHVRVISFDPQYSLELCGGTHTGATGNIGFFKIVSEGSIAAGIRRIEAVTGAMAEKFVNQQLYEMDRLRGMLKSKEVSKSVENLIKQHAELEKKIELMLKEKSAAAKNELIAAAEKSGDLTLIIREVDCDAATAKGIAFELKNSLESLFCVLGGRGEGKAHLTVVISESLVKKGWPAATAVIRELASEINGGGGGQDFIATAGGKNPDGIAPALNKARKMAEKMAGQ